MIQLLGIRVRTDPDRFGSASFCRIRLRVGIQGIQILIRRVRIDINSKHKIQRPPNSEDSQENIVILCRKETLKKKIFYVYVDSTKLSLLPTLVHLFCNVLCLSGNRKLVPLVGTQRIKEGYRTGRPCSS
jgi:hypothetical protein